MHLDHDTPLTSAVTYTIYGAGIIIGSLSAHEWLVYLSLVAVCLRLPVDAHKAWRYFRPAKPGYRRDEDTRA